MIKYTVKPMDSIYSIAERFGVALNSLITANPHINSVNIIPGTRMLIPETLLREVIYNILGSTTKLSSEQMKNLTAGRKRVVEFAGRHRGEVYINGPVSERKVSLTFDDGPDAAVTPRILDILKANKAKASFFCIGNQIDQFSGVVKRAFNEGHLILNHSWDHPYLSKLDSKSIKNEIVSTENKIKSITGKSPSLFRPPYGDIDERVLSAILQTNNKVIIWSIDTMDWVKGVDKNTITQNVLGNIRPGDIISMHSSQGHNADVEALPEIITGLRKKGFEIADLREMLN